jgi:hypothetical protein
MVARRRILPERSVLGVNIHSGFTYGSDTMAEIISGLLIKFVARLSHLPSEERESCRPRAAAGCCGSRLPPGRILG